MLENFYPEIPRYVCFESRFPTEVNLFITYFPFVRSIIRQMVVCKWSILVLFCWLQIGILGWLFVLRGLLWLHIWRHVNDRTALPNLQRNFIVASPIAILNIFVKVDFANDYGSKKQWKYFRKKEMKLISVSDSGSAATHAKRRRWIISCLLIG